VATVATVAVLAVVNPYFETAENLENILLQASFAGISAAGMTLLIVSGAFDLSVAGLLGLCGVVSSELLPSLGVFFTVISVLFLGLFLGLLNGLVVAKLRIPVFIATLGMMNIYIALAFIWTQGSRVNQLRILQARKLAIVESEIASINNLLPDNRDKRHRHDKLKLLAAGSDWLLSVAAPQR
jgi:ribose/xylose/arabinose/galactoside ABC-type transport system permease subunit